MREGELTSLNGYPRTGRSKFLLERQEVPIKAGKSRCFRVRRLACPAIARAATVGSHVYSFRAGHTLGDGESPLWLRATCHATRTSGVALRRLSDIG